MQQDYVDNPQLPGHDVRISAHARLRDTTLQSDYGVLSHNFSLTQHASTHRICGLPLFAVLLEIFSVSTADGMALSSVAPTEVHKYAEDATDGTHSYVESIGVPSNHWSGQPHIRASRYDQSQFTPGTNRFESQTLSLGHAPPFVQGIDLVFSNSLPDRFRSIFPFNPFNAVQSKCFNTVYRTDDNFVLAAPTGSGKTVILELAICRLLSAVGSDQYKIVYQAPTKALCAERQRDWEAKFAPLDIRCAALTGDTDQIQLRNVQKANVIITTPEKWDSMTRKWKDRAQLMKLVKLFLIDEVHFLKDSRGATLEAVVSRMKTVGSDIRFVALSATVPNLEDVARWLRRNATSPHLPALQAKFGEEFRPVKLQKFVYGYKCNANEFALDKVCESK